MPRRSTAAFSIGHFAMAGNSIAQAKVMRE
jgi:hypothetical protein